MTRVRVIASQLLLDAMDERDLVAAEYRTSIGEHRRDLCNLGTVLDAHIKNLKHIGAEERLGEISVDVITIGLGSG